MALKQLSWRCSNQALFLCTLLFSISLQAMEQSSSSSSSSSNQMPPTHFHRVPIHILESVFDSAPESIKNIVEHLKDPNFLEEDEYRSAFFVGDPGTGKSTLAKAIAYKAQFELTILPASTFLGGQRNEAAARLRDKLDTLASIKVNQLVVIDECNRLGEHADSPHHDTDSLSEALWTFLDEQRGNYHFFLIGTMNRADRLPDPLKSRIIPQYFELTLVKDPLVKQQIFRNRLLSPLTKLHDEVETNPEYLCSIFQQLPPCSGRDLAGLVLAVKDAYRVEDKTEVVKVISKRHIEAALSRFQNAYNKMKMGQKQETDEERRHKELVDMHEAHFVQQQKIQIALQGSQMTHYSYCGGGGSGLVLTDTKQSISEGGVAEAMSYLTDDQISVFERRTQESRNRKTYERRLEERAAARKKAKEDESCIIA